MKTGASAAVADNISWACERPRMFVKRPISASSVNIFWLIGVIVVILAVLAFLGLR